MLLNLQEIEALNRQARAELLRRRVPRVSLYDFGKRAWDIVEPGTPMIENWHAGAIADHLEAVALGQILELVINIPPGTAKSLWGAVFFPAWIWSWWPEFRGIFTSYDSKLASRDSVRCRAVIASEWYREEFMYPAGWDFAADQDEKTLYENTKKGVRQAFGVGSGGTGFRGDLVLVDDPISIEQAYSKQYRERSIRWWDHTMSNRQNNPRAPRRIIIGQRVHDDDLTGHAIKRGTYQVLSLPAEYDPKRCSVTVRKVNGEEVYWEDPRTEEGELLFPGFLTAEFLKAEKEILGSDSYAGQYQQSPHPPGGSIFKKECWRFWKPDGRAADSSTKRPPGCTDLPASPLAEDLDEIIISVDCAFKDKASSSYVDMAVWARKGVDRFLLDKIRGKWSFTKTIARLKYLIGLWPKARKKIIEAKANGIAVEDALRAEVSGIVLREPKGSKEARAHAVSPQQESGHVYLKDGAPWVPEYIAELSAFPLGTNDDQVDTTTQALLEWSPSSKAARARALCAAGRQRLAAT